MLILNGKVEIKRDHFLSNLEEGWKMKSSWVIQHSCVLQIFNVLLDSYYIMATQTLIYYSQSQLPHVQHFSSK